MCLFSDKTQDNYIGFPHFKHVQTRIKKKMDLFFWSVSQLTLGKRKTISWTGRTYRDIQYNHCDCKITAEW